MWKFTKNSKKQPVVHRIAQALLPLVDTASIKNKPGSRRFVVGFTTHESFHHLECTKGWNNDDEAWRFQHVENNFFQNSDCHKTRRPWALIASEHMRPALLPSTSLLCEFANLRAFLRPNNICRLAPGTTGSWSYELTLSSVSVHVWQEFIEQ